MRHHSTNSARRLTLALAAGLALTGCTGTTYSSHFDCPMGEGAGCASLSRVNKMLDRGELNLSDDPVKNTGEGGQASPSPSGSQVYVYYGPDKLGRLVSTALQQK